MRGYFKSGNLNQSKLEHVRVCCRRCGTSWDENYTITANIRPVDGILAIYDFCDICRTPSDKEG